MRKIFFVALLVVAVAAVPASAGRDAYGQRPWSQARLTTHMKLANAQISLHDRMLNRQAARLRSAQENAQAALRIANETYYYAVEWTLTLVDCIRLRDKYEQACLDEAVANDLLPEDWVEEE